MGTRPLTSEETLRIEERLEDAKKRQRLLNQYIAKMEQELATGTCHCTSPEDWSRINKEVAEIVKQDNERGRKLEVKMYGHELSGKERRLSRLGMYPKRIDI